MPEGRPLRATLPVAVAQVGCVIVPKIGASGVAGCVLIVALVEATEVQPTELVTLKVYAFAVNPLKVAVVVDPVIVAPPVAVTVQLPDGSPLRATLPVAVAQVGCVIVPTIGASGVAGWVLMVALVEATEVQPTELVTVNVYVPAARPVNVVEVVDPVFVAPPVAVTVQLPEGRPLRATLPVAVAQVGCVIVPTIGVSGVAGCVLMVALVEATEVQPTEFVTVKV